MESLVEKARLGCRESKLILVERLKPLLYSSLRKYKNYKEAYEDLYQDGILEILESIQEFDPSKGVYFPAYVKLRLRYLYLNKYSQVEIFSLNEKVSESEFEKIDLLVDHDEGFKRILDKSDHMDLYRAYDSLSPREKEVVDLYFIENISMVEIAKNLGLSYRTVVNTKIRALDKIRKNFKI